MESKKPLIIVPPMSEPLQKLKEILEGIAVEENIDIMIVETANEFNRLVGSCGQALIIMSNAKTCATLLQDTKGAIAKNNTKVILLTPKEIPQKTLVKFTKIGLTEAILENSPPKTLLYKVKLLLRSIKLQVKEEAKQQVIKSMLDMNANISDNQEINQEKAHIGEIESEETSPEKENKIKAVADEESLDYLSNLKGKKSAAEDSIDTHWKSKREKTISIDQSESTEEKEKKNYTEAEIDNYFRGKRKTDENQATEEVENKRKSNFEEDLSEGFLKTKKGKKEELSEPEPFLKEEKFVHSKDEEDGKIRNFDLDLEISPSEDEKKANSVEEEVDKRSKRERLREDPVDGPSITREKEVEDLGGHYTGKIGKTKEEEAIPEIEELQMAELSSSEIEKKKREKIIEEAKDHEPKKKNKLEETSSEKDPSEGQVDHIDNFLRGSLQNENEEEKAGDDFLDAKEVENPIEKEEKNRKKEQKLEDNEDLYEREKAEMLDANDLLDKEREKTELASSEDDNLSRDSESVESIDKYMRSKAAQKAKEEKEFGHRDFSAKSEEVEDEEKKDLDKTNLEEDERKRRSLAQTNIEEKERQKDVHEGQTDRISTYYGMDNRSEKEHDWDINHEKSASVEVQSKKPQREESVKLDLIKSASENKLSQNKKKIDDSETTIDYRKLKEEFEAISKGESTDGSAISTTGQSGKNPFEINEDGKVIEVASTSVDFVIEILNLINLSDTKPSAITKTVALKLAQNEKAYFVAYKYKSNEKKYEVFFNTYSELADLSLNSEKEKFEIINKDEKNGELCHSFTMPTWICRSISDEKDGFWRDIELPRWAHNELTDKEVELVYPFFDGVERLGFIHILFPQGLNTSNEKNIILYVEMLRTVFLEFATKTQAAQDSESTPEDGANKKNVLGFFGSIFGKKKAG